MATTYTVSNTESASFSSLSDVSSATFLQNDTISIKCGDVFDEDLTFPSSGTVGSPIIINSYGSGSNPVINKLIITQKHDLIISNIETNSTGVYEYGCQVLGSYNISFTSCTFDGNNKRADAFLAKYNGTEWTHDITITDCIAKNAGDIDAGAEGGTGFQISDGCYNVLIDNSQALECEEAGLQVFTNIANWGVWDSHDVTFRKCYVFLTGHTDITSQAIVLGWKAYNCLVEKCYTVGTRHGMTVDLSVPGPNTIRNNIFENGVECFVAVGSNNTTVENNTFILGANSVKGVWWRENCGSGNIFKNNIVLALNGTWSQLYIIEAGSEDVESDSNCFYNWGEVLRMVYQDTNEYDTDLTLWKTASSQDTNSITTDPLLRSSTDYHLTKTSPCIDAGETITSITTDYDGNPRKMGAGQDIGAYEYSKFKGKHCTLR